MSNRSYIYVTPCDGVQSGAIYVAEIPSDAYIEAQERFIVAFGDWRVECYALTGICGRYEHEGSKETLEYVKERVRNVGMVVARVCDYDWTEDEARDE